MKGNRVIRLSDAVNTKCQLMELYMCIYILSEEFLHCFLSVNMYAESHTSTEELEPLFPTGSTVVPHEGISQHHAGSTPETSLKVEKRSAI